MIISMRDEKRKHSEIYPFHNLTLLQPAQAQPVPHLHLVGLPLLPAAPQQEEALSLTALAVLDFVVQQLLTAPLPATFFEQQLIGYFILIIV
ncbi:hypothetical protein KDRO_E00790 [Kluyveromyces lactis]|nr:hypothetical protein KDRO_E00790 [Kluyveromyces lactis]